MLGRGDLFRGIIFLESIIFKVSSLSDVYLFVGYPEYIDISVSTGLLWSAPELTTTSCAIKCVFDTDCISFFYNNVTCSGYNKTLPENTVVDVGQRFYSRQDDLCFGIWCENGGTCINGYCNCPAYWTGELCQVSTNACQPNPCLNGGMCSSRSSGEISCACQPAYTGPVCADLAFNCDASWMVDAPSEMCFKMMTTPSTWSDARATCLSEHGGDLAVIDDDIKFEKVTPITSRYCSNANESFIPIWNSCYWLSESALFRTDAVAYCESTPGGHLASIPNNETQIKVVQETRLLEGNLHGWIGVNDEVLEEHYVNYDGSPITWRSMLNYNGLSYMTRDCVYIDHTDLSWHEGNCYVGSYRSLCERTIEENLWLGGTFDTSDGQWEWITGTGIDMSKWIQTEPVTGTTTNCTIMRSERNNTGFAQRDCNTLNNFVCQKKMYI